MKKFKLFKMLAVLIVLITSINTMWAGDWFTDNMWQVYGWNGTSNGWHWTGIGKNYDCELGVMTSSTSITIKGVGANTSGSGITWVGVHCFYLDGSDNWKNLTYRSGDPNKYWDDQGLWDMSIDKTVTPGNYHFGMDFWMKDNGDNYNQNYRRIKWTIPGFVDAPASKNFGTAPTNSEAETTISFTHYGNALTTGNCSITGTNRTEFEVRSISESGVTVVFKPSSNGSKSATLTINDGTGLNYSSVSISLSGTAGTSGTVTRLYFNDYEYSGAGDWDASGAKYRFTCTYTSGVVTRYNMTLCDNTEHTYYADVDVRAGYNVSIDRYNPSSPYATWNTATPTSPALSSTNPYAKSTTIGNAYAANHPYNDITGGTVYYDNSKSGITNTLYLVVGHDHNIANNNSDAYSSGYAMTNITNTKMYYHTFSATTWHDADYYGVIGATSDPTGDHKWGSSSLESKGSTRGYTAAYNNLFGLLSGSTYLATAQSKTGGALSFSKDPTLNTTQTFNYALSTDGGSTYPALTSGVNTPGQLKLESYNFTSATAVSKNADQTLSANATTYTKSMSNVAYTGTTVLTESNTREGYTFMGWYKGNSTIRTNSSTHSFTYYPQGDSTYTARYKAHRYTIAFDNNDDQYSSAPTATGSTASISNVVYDQNVTLTANGFEREGYTFAGWYREADGSGASYTNEESVSNLTATDGATVTLYAQWNETTHDVTVEYKYGDTSIDDDDEVTGVGIVTTQDVTAPATIGGYSFTTWSDMPSDVQTSSSLTGRTITINATNDGQTITANYEPSTYVGDIEGVDGGDGAYSVVYNETSLTPTTPATRDGYEVGGYYLNYDEKANPKYYNQIAAGDGSFLASISTYTDENKKWIRTSAPATIYASWTPKPYDITLHAELPGDATGSEGTSKITATMGTTTFSPSAGNRPMPSENGYNFLGYFTDDTPSNIQILNANGTNYLGTKYIDVDGNWSWADNIDAYGHWSAKTYTVSLDPENGSSTTDITATFDATTNLSRIVKPSKTGYTFAGYYTGQGGSGTQLINADGDWIASVSGYTGDNGSGAATWKYYTNSTITLYAKWTQTINFNQNSATVNGTTSLAATYHTALSTGSIENPKRIGYAFAGWATAADGTVVIGTDGTVNSVDGYTDGSKNWVHAGESELVATWDEDICTFTGAAGGTDAFDWDNAANWEGGKLPTEYSEVHLNYGVIIKEGESYHVGKIVIGESRTLTLFCGGVLEVAGTITKEGGTATDPSSISLSSTSAYQSALIFDNTAGNTQASVSLATSARYNPEHPEYSFQYVAVPMTSVDVSNTFNGQGIYTYVWKEGDGWERRGYYSSISGFEALGVTSKDGVYFGTSGTLVSTANIVDRPLRYTSGDGVGMNMIGNSWTAPIKISEMEITGNAESTVYVYNSSTGSWVGNPTAVSGDAIVPAMQAYLIKATSGGGSLSIDYDKAVRGVAASDRTAPLFAPKRSNSAGIAEIRMRVSDSEDYYSDLRLFENEQFTNEFDNGWEARYIAGEGFTGQLYAQTDDKMTVLATPNLEGQVVGFVPGMATNYTISFAGDGKGYYLNDLDEQESTFIEEGNTYVFTPNESTNATRFVISKMPIHKTTTGTDVIYDGVKARKQMIDGILYIIRDGRIYDATGVLVK